ncbi:hypothetical protein LOK49_Contig175G00004 [Camellia lanceoleosa]|nr:hypothetical protein LOK49_Contig175G00004 [Camellia lanceoleosa]
MASSSFSLTSPSSCLPITDEQFNDFHSIDRILYSRLVLGLARDPAESMQVMALWLLLERGSYNCHLVNKILSLPGSVINSLVDETAKCLKCTEGDRKFGEIIEAIHMQEVPAEGQVLYARLVVHSASVINVVLEGQRKAKFSINGKHVWARKYVKKNPKSPSHQPTSPDAAAPKP